MLRSMTGFGSHTIDTEDYVINVEIKTLNSKFIEIGMRLSPMFSHREVDIKALINEKIERGKVNAVVNFTPKNPNLNRMKVNRPLVQAYFQELTETAHTLGADTRDIFRIVMQMPDVLVKEGADDSLEAAWQHLRKAVVAALDDCDQYRQGEGKALETKFLEYIGQISQMLDRVEARDPQRAERVREKLRQHLVEIRANELYDANRFEQEMIYYLEKLDISEEKVRLRHHLEFFAQTLRSPESNGRKLGFIAQEIGREINTIGSKANDAEIQRIVVNMKEELEKIKEQVLNIL